MNHTELKRLQALPLEDKVALTCDRIFQWHAHHDGMVFVAFSGGKDSTVLLYIVREILGLDIPAVFYDTGLEFPEIKEFVKWAGDKWGNVITRRPKHSFLTILRKYGYPLISKRVATNISRYRGSTCAYQKYMRLNPVWNPEKNNRKEARGVIPKKYRYLAVDEAPPVGAECCHFLKIDPAKRYIKESGRLPILATMANESDKRLTKYLKTGCNSFEGKSPISTPMGFWLESDIWDFIKKYNVNYSKAYDMGYERTGCIFCPFGMEHDRPGKERFKLLEKTHPKLHKYMMEKLGFKAALSWKDDKKNMAVDLDASIDWSGRCSGRTKCRYCRDEEINGKDASGRSRLFSESIINPAHRNE